MNAIEELFKNSGGWMEGHTAFRNGFHGNGWIEKGFIVRSPKLFAELITAQVEQIKNNFPEVNLVVGPIVTGAIIATHIARLLDCECTVTWKTSDEIGFHRMYIPESGKKVVLVDDLIFSGEGLRDNVRFLKEKNMDIVGISTWVNRQKDEIEGVKVVSLFAPPFEFYDKDECHLCKENIPLKYEDIRE